MRIGIVTFHRSINNGAVMQCYALSKRLKKEFPDSTVEVVDYHMPLVEEKVYDTSFHHYFKGSIKHKLGFLLHILSNIEQIKQDRNRKVSFERAITKLPLSHDKIYSNSITDLIDYLNASYDVVIAGSDAIWNYSVRGFPNPYFLSKDVRAKKLSYAASCYGMNYEKIPDWQKAEIKDILDTYSFLGTRDLESESFLHSIGCAVTPVHTCDPTAFLDVDDLPIDVEALKQKLINRGFDESKTTIGIMGKEDMCKMIRRMFGKKYQLVSLYNYNSICDVNLNDLSPYEWAYVFRFFNVTVTTYFHGTMLSLRNGVPVLSIALDNEYSRKHVTKVEDLLHRLDLDNCYWKTDYQDVNYNEIKTRITELIQSDMRMQLIEKMNQESMTIYPFLKAIGG